MKLYCKIFSLFFVLIWTISCARADLYEASIYTVIDAKNAAQRHNNVGNQYFSEGDYYAAIKEYKIAIGINPNAQTTATYLNNLGKVYLILGEIQAKNNLKPKEGQNFSKMAEKSFEEAILKDCMKIEYYQNLIKAYELTGALEIKKNYFLNNRDKNPFNVIPAALILKKQGHKEYANMLLDDFISENPNLIISDSLKKFIESETIEF